MLQLRGANARRARTEAAVGGLEVVRDLDVRCLGHERSTGEGSLPRRAAFKGRRSPVVVATFTRQSRRQGRY
jgi:hypothetical protein